MSMKKLFVIAILVQSVLIGKAQSEDKPFRAYIYNKEYEVYIRMDLYDESITIPGQDLYGHLPGYLGKNNNTFCWVITSAEITGSTAKLSMINDYGSEDLTAKLTIKDSLYVLKQIEGSTLKVPKNGKWQKLPKTLEFKRRH